MFNLLHFHNFPLKSRTLRSMLFIVLTFATLACLAASHSPAEERAITRAAYQNQKAELARMADEFTGYNRAYALYRLASLNYSERDPREVGEHLHEAAAILADLPGAEAATLRAAALSMAMGLAPEDAASQGPLVQQLLAEGKQDEAARPRARLIEGINLFYTPPAFGGGLEQAKQALEAALDGFAGQGASGEVSWGEAEAHLWLGQVELKLQRPTAARKAFQQALAIDPECAWAEHWLARI